MMDHRRRVLPPYLLTAIGVTRLLPSLRGPGGTTRTILPGETCTAEFTRDNSDFCMSSRETIPPATIRSISWRFGIGAPSSPLKKRSRKRHTRSDVRSVWSRPHTRRSLRLKKTVSKLDTKHFLLMVVRSDMATQFV